MVFLIGFFVYRQKASQKPVELTAVKKEDLKQEVSASGTISGDNVANLKFLTGGKLAYTKVKVGDEVKKGDVIAGLDTQALAIALQQAQNTLRDKSATLDNIYDQVKDHDKDESFTQKQTRTTAEVAKNNAFDSVKAAQRSFQDAVITSPIDGIITSQDPIAGQTVGLADTIAQVVDFSQLVFRADVDEADISKVALGQKAEVTLNAYGDKIFYGTVIDIIPQTKTASNGGTVVTVKISLSDTSIQPIAGLNGDVNIVMKEVGSILALPQDAVTSDSTVIVKTGQTYKLQKVTTGLQSDTDVQITSGLNENDQVVLSPNDFLKSHPNVK